MASVAMNGCTSKWWMSAPAIAPNPAPIATIITAASHGFHPALTSITPATDANAMTALTERSIRP